MIDHIINGKAFTVLNIIDEYKRECLATLVNLKIKADDVIDQLFSLFVFEDIPEHIRSDNGQECTTRAVRRWLGKLGVKPSLLSLAVPGRVVTLNHLTARCETNCSTVRSLPRLRKLKC